MGFRQRLTFVSAGAVAIAILVSSVVVFVATRQQVRGQVDETLRAMAGLANPQQDPVSGQFLISLDAGPLAGERGYAQFVPAEGALPPGLERPGEIEFAVPGSNGRVVLLRREPLVSITETDRQVAAGEQDEFFRDESPAGRHLRIYTKQVVPGLAVQVAQPLDDVDRTLNRLALILLFVVLAGTAVAALAGRFIAAAALGPVTELTKTVEEVTSTMDLTRRIDVSGDDELARLAASFNQMMAALENSLNSQRHLVADASHELRTPLTSIRTNLELLQRGHTIEPAERDAVVVEVVSQIQELGNLIGDLIEAARGPERTARVEEFRLDDLVEDVVARFRSPAGPEIETSTGPVSMVGDRARIERAVSNLLDNAIKWSPPGATVYVSTSGGAVIVRDQGPGVPPEDVDRIFDRFYRSPAARARPGSGLGLAIVMDVATEHGGRVGVANAEDGGAVFRLEFPEASTS